MVLQKLRKERKLTQRELAQMSGVNFRSLQDYEQGHKKLTSASGDVLLRLSTVLGCSVEELLMEGDATDLAPAIIYDIAIDEICGQRFYCQKHGVAGRWICIDTTVATMFYYEGKQYILPLQAVFKKENITWLREAALMQMEERIEEILFGKIEMEVW